MKQSTNSKTINTIPFKGVVNKQLSNASKKKMILKAAVSRAPEKDFTIDDLHKSQQQELSKRRYEKDVTRSGSARPIWKGNLTGRTARPRAGGARHDFHPFPAARRHRPGHVFGRRLRPEHHRAAAHHAQRAQRHACRQRHHHRFSARAQPD